MSGTRSSAETPTAEAWGRAGLQSGPRMLNIVAMPSSLRVGPACLNPGWKSWAKARVMPVSRNTSATRSGGIARLTPSTESTSDAPDEELAARLPCLTTGTPAAAAITDAADEMFRTAPKGSPPVPTMSSARESTSSGTAFSRTASRKPTISSTVSPLNRRATRSPAICADVAAPLTTSRMAQVDSATDRSFPSSIELSTEGQVGASVMRQE